jgi:hypothetical protein
MADVQLHSPMTANESVHSHRKVKAGSDRSFGLFFAIGFALFGFAPLVLHGASVRGWALGIAGAFGVVAWVAPSLLKPVNRLWFRLGLALHSVVNPIIMGLIYFGAVVPMGLLLRALGKDLLRLKREPKATTYWIMREPQAPPRGSMTRQF